MLGLGVCALVSRVSCVVPSYGYGSPYSTPYATPYTSPYDSSPTTLPLAVIAESPYSVAKQSANIPLVMVDRNTLPIIRNADISSVSPTQPLVTCRTNNQYVTDATPAVRVVLKRPLYISPQQHSIPFPAEMSVLYGGLRMGLPVGAVVAPVPHYDYNRPQLVRVVYAIPSGPLPLQYPYYDPFAYRAPSYPQTQVVSVAPFQSRPPPQLQPQPQFNYSPNYYYTPASAPAANAILPTASKRPKPPLVTVLDFPSAVATPDVLYYQPPLDDSELGNRAPPQAIAPAGIVQSTQPLANLESFLNSKESPVLNALREQAEKNKDKEQEEGEHTVEAL